ncbi:hypothetical protein DD237_004988 [Peronospora effusa]|uniref:Uncharacterized protein n=1 Tax=Peronospora effusa TaxID=542832 RepID=A0A425CDG1_9STRA|nr:hypothetical protein DD237_004988 [Peronospora effusa]
MAEIRHHVLHLELQLEDENAKRTPFGNAFFKEIEDLKYKYARAARQASTGETTCMGRKRCLCRGAIIASQ